MSKMQAFHMLLFTPSRRTDLYLKAMKLLTKASRDEMSALQSDLSWQQWAPTL